MNRLYILVILIVCMACQSSHQTTLKGVIKNYDGALVRIAVQGSLKRDTLKVNEKGEFQYIPVVPQKGEVYELFVKGYRPGVPLFLSGGDQVNVEITLLPEQWWSAFFPVTGKGRTSIWPLCTQLKIHENGILRR